MMVVEFLTPVHGRDWRGDDEVTLNTVTLLISPVLSLTTAYPWV